MFNCAGCKTVQPAGTKAFRVVVEKRLKVYADGSKGWEIAKEANLCEHCYNAIEVKG